MDDRLGKVARALDALSVATGKAVSWLTLLMVFVTVIIVVLRYVFDAGLIWLQESLTWMHAAVFMLGAAYTLEQEEHVRVDIFYRNMGERGRAIVNALGVLLFLLPLAVFLAIEAWDYVRLSWSIREISRDTGGLPYPAIPLLKSIIIAMPVLLALQGVSLLLRSALVLRRR